MHRREERESVQDRDKRSITMLCIILPFYFKANISKENSRKMDKGL